MVAVCAARLRIAGRWERSRDGVWINLLLVNFVCNNALSKIGQRIVST
jgi:hypothetical protein